MVSHDPASSQQPSRLPQTGLPPGSPAWPRLSVCSFDTDVVIPRYAYTISWMFYVPKNFIFHIDNRTTQDLECAWNAQFLGQQPVSSPSIVLLSTVRFSEGPCPSQQTSGFRTRIAEAQSPYSHGTFFFRVPPSPPPRHTAWASGRVDSGDALPRALRPRSDPRGLGPRVPPHHDPPPDRLLRRPLRRRVCAGGPWWPPRRGVPDMLYMLNSWRGKEVIPKSRFDQFNNRCSARKPRDQDAM